MHAAVKKDTEKTKATWCLSLTAQQHEKATTNYVKISRAYTVTFTHALVFSMPVNVYAFSKLVHSVARQPSFPRFFLELRQNLYQEMLTMKMHVNDPMGNRLRHKRCVQVMWCIQMKNNRESVNNYLVYSYIYTHMYIYLWLTTH